jgi:hypothetical protein
LSPEVLDEPNVEANAAEKSDVFSLALILSDMFVEHLVEGAVEQLRLGDIFDFPENLENCLMNVIIKCWSHDAAQRPMFSVMFHDMKDSQFCLAKCIKAGTVEE